MIGLVLDNLRARRVAAVAGAVGLLAMAVMYTAIFPSFEDQLSMFAGEMPEFFEGMLGGADFTTPAGYIKAEVYALIAPFVACGVTISAAAALARAERETTLTDAYLAPVGRATLAVSFLLAAWSVALVTCVGVLVGVVVGGPLAGADLPLGGVLAATWGLLLLAMVAGAVAWVVGAATGAPSAATGAGWAFVVVSFLANSVGGSISGLSWLVDVSPWGWYGSGAALTEGFDPVVLLLALLAAALVPLGSGLFERRDLQL